MRPFTYARPQTIAETFALLDGAATDQLKLLAGGTDLLTLIKDEIVLPSELIDIKRLNELDDTIELTADGVQIGALATLAEIEDSPHLRGGLSAASQAASLAATPQLRNMATIGGNLLQRPRCWYFRDREVLCWLKDGDDCPAVEGENQLHAIFGGSPCHAVHPSDLATALLMLGASVVVRGSNHARIVPLDDFFALPTDERRTENMLAPDELIVSVIVPDRPATASSVYLKAMDRKVWAFALIGVAAFLEIQNGRIADARLALGGVAPIPLRRPEAESVLLNAAPSADAFRDAAQRALGGATPLSHNAYKVQLAEALIVRALESAATSTNV